jgi:DNA-directed RNA polymerase sigma subunit (sigma70/sigma32)
MNHSTDRNHGKARNAFFRTASMSQQEVADVLGVTRQRVLQIEQQALSKIKKAIQSEARSAGKTVDEWLFEARA